MPAPGATAPSLVADAAEHSDRTALDTLLTKKTGINVPQPDGMTALHWAALHGEEDVVRRLIEAGANVQATNRYGVSPLSLACQNGSHPTVELLLEHGADPNSSVRGGESALMTAARTGKPGPIHALLRRGAAVETRERRGQTALMWAAAEGNTEAVVLLLQAGADPRFTLPDSGFNAFFFAAREGRSEVVHVLLKAGVGVNEVMEPSRPVGKGPGRGTSALDLAIENGHFELALALVDAGANPNDQRSGVSPLHRMTWVRKPPRGEDNGAPPPLGSGQVSSLPFIRELVKRGADINARLKNGRGGPGQFSRMGATPFLMASANADLAYMRLLLDLGADPKVPNADGCTPLMVACGIGVGADAANEVAGEEPEVLEAAKLLLSLGADINVTDANGETAMHGAALKNLPKVVQFLAERGAKPEIWNRTNKYGWTPLLLAEGHRPGNFKPSFETIAAIQAVLRSAGVPPEATHPARH